MIILCADDFGLSDGVSRGIVKLGLAERLSATSAIVNFDRWSADAERLQTVRPTMAIGLHLNLTLGRPMVPSNLAGHTDDNGQFVKARLLSQRAMGFGRPSLDAETLKLEFLAQLTAFRDATGNLPDFIDGHQHVHGLPVVRHALVAAIKTWQWPQLPLVRIPSNKCHWLRQPSDQWIKRTLIAKLTDGFRARVEAAGLPTNDSFSGFSSFTIGRDYTDELQASFEQSNPPDQCHLVMCHPGYVDDELRMCGDPVVERRQEEMAGIMEHDGLEERIWHPQREADGTIDWSKAVAA